MHHFGAFAWPENDGEESSISATNFGIAVFFLQDNEILGRCPGGVSRTSWGEGVGISQVPGCYLLRQMSSQ